MKILSDTIISGALQTTGVIETNEISSSSGIAIHNLLPPTGSADAATKKYVDDNAGTGSSGSATALKIQSGDVCPIGMISNYQLLGLVDGTIVGTSIIDTNDVHLLWSGEQLITSGSYPVLNTGTVAKTFGGLTIGHTYAVEVLLAVTWPFPSSIPCEVIIKKTDSVSGVQIGTTVSGSIIPAYESAEETPLYCVGASDVHFMCDANWPGNYFVKVRILSDPGVTGDEPVESRPFTVCRVSLIPYYTP